MKCLLGKLTYANVISTLCLILLVGGGTAYAASEMLPKGSVGAKQIKKEAVTPAKLSKASKATLTGPKGATGQTGPQGPKGDTGAKGDRGEAGLKGEIGPSDAYEVGDASDNESVPPLELSLPAGNYVASAKYTAYEAQSTSDSALCTLAGGEDSSLLYSSIEATGVTQNTASGSILVNLTSPGSVTLTCIGGVTFGYANITAIKVGTLH